MSGLGGATTATVTTATNDLPSGCSGVPTKSTTTYHPSESSSVDHHHHRFFLLNTPNLTSSSSASSDVPVFTDRVIHNVIQEITQDTPECNIVGVNPCGARIEPAFKAMVVK